MRASPQLRHFRVQPARSRPHSVAVRLRHTRAFLLGKGQRLLVEHVILALLLPGVAGAVNASGFLMLGMYTSHMTGQTARIGDEIAQGRWSGGINASGCVAVFVAGAAISTALINRANRLYRARYVGPLMLETLALATYTALTRSASQDASFSLSALLCFSMGLQNAMVTRISGAVIRTTHVTGMMTDIGIESVRLVEWVSQEFRRRAAFETLGILRLFFAAPEWKKLRLHLSICAAFLTGALVGPELFLHLGPLAMLIPCAVLLSLACFDYLFGIRSGVAAAAGRANEIPSVV